MQAKYKEVLGLVVHYTDTGAFVRLVAVTDYGLADVTLEVGAAIGARFSQSRRALRVAGKGIDPVQHVAHVYAWKTGRPLADTVTRA